MLTLLFWITLAFPCSFKPESANPLYLFTVCVFVCMKSWGQPQLPSSVVFHLVWDRVSHWTCSLPVWLAWLVQEHLGFSCLCFLSAEVMSSFHCAWCFTWVLGIKYNSLYFLAKHFNGRAIFPALHGFFFSFPRWFRLLGDFYVSTWVLELTILFF